MVKTSNRKLDHIRICLNKQVQARQIKTGFEEIFFVHRALPEINLEEVDTSIDFFGHRLSAPIVIEPMTGGTKEACKVNAVLAKAAESLGLAMGIGSQRAAIENPKLASTFQINKKNAPHVFLLANLGAAEIAKGYGLREAKKAVAMIEADALVIHLNPLQEVIQPEGNPSYRGVLKKIEEIAEFINVPVMMKETGAGICAEDAIRLEEVGVKGIDVSGVGGTSWAAVEYFRASETQDIFRQRLGETFWDWGIPTVASIVEVCQSTDLLVVSSGGIRTGIDAAKSIALGSDAVGLALPLLRPALEDKVTVTLRFLIDELKTAMFLVGAKTINDLKSSPLIITGKLAEWISVRGFKLEQYARR